MSWDILHEVLLARRTELDLEEFDDQKEGVLSEEFWVL